MTQKLIDWGIADTRINELGKMTFAKRVTQGEDSAIFWCFPAFYKIRWREGEPIDAKAYIMSSLD